MRELNWKPGQSAELNILGERASAAGSGVQPARILEFSGRCMRLAADLKVQGGTAVRLEWDRQLLLGQVLNTEPGGFWIEIHHMLLDTTGSSWQKNGWQRG
jgi:hypothetical protein